SMRGEGFSNGCRKVGIGAQNRRGTGAGQTPVRHRGIPEGMGGGPSDSPCSLLLRGSAPIMGGFQFSPHRMNDPEKLALIGSGASAIYVLKHLLDHAPAVGKSIGEISIFEKGTITGMGMPYNPLTTDRFDMSNISSEELPELPQTFADWLRAQDRDLLEELGIPRDQEITEDEVYSRLSLGRYLQSQYQALVAGLEDAGIRVREHAECPVTDISRRVEPDHLLLVTEDGATHRFDRVVIATGHCWKGEDRPEHGYYASPWPISKLLPAEGELHDFTIGTLGASLSAFDVIASLAHRHGGFSGEGAGLVFKPFPGTGNFKIVMHAAEGLLPHLQFDQVEPLREIYRHVSREELFALLDADGFLRLDTYFDRVCRPVLSKAFAEDGRADVVELLEDPEFGFRELVEKMTAEHEYTDAFKGMRKEMPEAVESVEGHQPIHWKEIMDDLMYTLNFHAERMPAEDHLKLRSVVMPFLMNVMAAMPLPSADIMLALHKAGKLDLVSGKAKVEDGGNDGDTKVTVDDDGKESSHRYRMFVDCSGQKPVELDEYPFPSLAGSGCARRARAKFLDPEKGIEALPEEKKKDAFEEDGEIFYPTGGVDVDAAYRLVDARGLGDSRIHDIAFPHTSGVRPYSYGLQACNETARIVVEGMLGKGQ
ncbi:MAG: hypothetical protein EOP88_18130, partial [Verrucomicrobiaceae bacterium]